MPCASPPSLTGFRLPHGFRVVSLEEAAAAAGVHERTMREHCTEGNAWAWKLFSGHGPWRVVVDESGLPADPPGYQRPYSASAPLPEGYRVTWLKEAADSTRVDERTLRKHCTRGHVWAWRLFSGHGPWRVVLNPLNEAADPPAPSEELQPAAPAVELSP